MATQLYLIAPTNADPARFPQTLRDVLAAAEVAALLVPRGDHSENAYKALVKSIVPVAQHAGCAVLIEGEPGLVRTLGADGLHVAGPARAVKDAVAALKPQMIVGAGDIRTRHDAMTKGELDVDYVLFGPLSGPIDPASREMARWWAETMEIPSVLSDPAALRETLHAEGCEFLALGEGIWQTDDPAKAVAALAAKAEALQ